MRLDRSVSLPQAVLYGIGVIVGAGIYTLIGLAAGISGNLLWLSFVIAGIIAALTALSYAKLSARFPKEAAETAYMINATKKRGLGFFVGYLSFLTTVFSVATVAFGFAAYFKLFFDVPAAIVAAVLIILLTIVNLFGIQDSVKLSNILTYVTVAGLLSVIFLGARFVGKVNLLIGFDGSNIFQNTFPLGNSLFLAAALIFFAYLGFEELPNISEEIKEPRKNVPKAIFLSLIAATIIYVSISIIAVSVVPPAALAHAADPNVPLTQGPLALVADTVMPGFGFWLSIMALCAIASTLSVLLVVSSRVLYGLSEQHLLPPKFREINPKSRVPVAAVICAGAIAVAFALAGNIVLLGNLATMGVFLLFFFTHISLIIIKYRENSFKFAHSPRNLARFDVLAIIGAVFCAFMFLTQYWRTVNLFGAQVPLILFGAVIFLTAIPVYYLVAKDSNRAGSALAGRKRIWAHKGL